MTEPRARERALHVANERIEPTYGREAANRAGDTLLDDDLWTWLATATDRAEDMRSSRALDLAVDVDDHEADDALLGHIDRAQQHLAAARDRRRDELLQDELDDYPERANGGDSS